MIVYYAHSTSSYGSTQEATDLAKLHALGFEVFNPNNPQSHSDYKREGMDCFFAELMDCQALAFRPFTDGTIGAGVATEIEWARDLKLPVFEIEPSVKGRTLSIADTRRLCLSPNVPRRCGICDGTGREPNTRGQQECRYCGGSGKANRRGY